MISTEVRLTVGAWCADDFMAPSELQRHRGANQGTLIRELLRNVELLAPRLIGWLPAWGIFLQPLGFLLFFTAAVQKTKRIPFDLPEANRRLVAGPPSNTPAANFSCSFRRRNRRDSSPWRG